MDYSNREDFINNAEVSLPESFLLAAQWQANKAVHLVARAARQCVV
jgi:hypothetical protein